jgi:hypothetical protein
MKPLFTGEELNELRRIDERLQRLPLTETSGLRRTRGMRPSVGNGKPAWGKAF